MTEIAVRFKVDFDSDGTFTDESAYVISAQGEMRLAPPEMAIVATQGMVSRCSVTLDNQSGRYSPLRTDGANYANIQDGKIYQRPCYLEVSVNGGSSYSKIFTGIVKSLTENTPAPGKAQTVVLEARSLEDSILNRRVSTTVADLASWVAAGGITEADAIEAVLTQAGVDAGDMALDAGLWNLAMPVWDDASPVEVAWRLAAAAGGQLYVDPAGVWRYENNQHWLSSPHNASVATITRAGFAGAQPAWNDTELYNEVEVEATVRQVTATDDTVWESEAAITVPAGESVTVWATFSDPIIAVTGVTWDAYSSGGKDITTDVTCAREDYAQRMKLTFTNGNATLAAQVWPVRVTGRAAPVAAKPVKLESSSDSFWTDRAGRKRRLTGNPYVQSEAQAEYLATFLRDRHETPRLSHKLQGVPGAPGRRLGDYVTITDAKVSSANRTGYVTAVSWRYSSGGYWQDLEVLDNADLFPYVGSYFVVGTDALGGTKKVYY